MMKKITKSDITQIKDGNHAILMDCLDFLLDSYDENKFDLGYKSCLEDLSVRSQRLAHVLNKHIADTYLNCSELEDDLAKVIENYYKEALKIDKS